MNETNSKINTEVNSEFDSELQEFKGDNLVLCTIIINSSNSNTYGCILLKLNKTSKTIEQVSCVLSRFREFIDQLTTKENYVEIESYMNKIKFSGNYLVSLSNDLESHIINDVSDSIVNDILKDIKLKTSENFKALILPVISRILIDKMCEIKIKYQNISQIELEEIYQGKQNQPENFSSSGENKSNDLSYNDFFKVDQGEVIDANLVLAPVSGTPIYSLQVDDEIMIKIDNKTEKGKHYNQLLNLITEEKRIIPTRAKIKKILYNENNEYLILVDIGNELYGRIIEQEQVKIKKYETEEETLLQAEVQDNHKKFYVVMSVVILVLFIIVVFYFAIF